MDMLNILFPSKCALCDSILMRNERGVCEQCRKKLPMVTEPLCKHCGKPIPYVRQELCHDCEQKESLLVQGRALWLYTDKMKKAMADFKYQGCLADGDFYAGEMLRRRGSWIREKKIQCIIPVPLHWRKEWFRGFNQATYLAEHLGRELGVPVLEDALLRQHNTSPQKALNDRQRRENLKNVFCTNEKYREQLSGYTRILLVDDIYTTGSTLEECAKALKRTGDFQIFSLCLCIGGDSG